MPIRERLSKKQIHYDLRRIRTGTGVAATGGGSAHPLLSVVHSDTEVITPPDEGSLVLANDTPLWGVLLHNDTAGSALVTNATTWIIDQTPLWTGIHTFGVGKRGESLAFHTSMGEAHGLGGMVVIAPSASRRSTIVV